MGIQIQQEFKQAFAPIIGLAPKVVILGSLPGEASLQAQQYYAHPRNQFWRLLADMSGVDLLGLDYADKIGQLQQMPIILWDVVDKAKRQGSLDSEIKDAQVRDVGKLLQAYPSLQQVWFNGKQAAKLGRGSLQNACVKTVVLPSSSAAYTLAYELKLKQWQQAWDNVLG